MQVRQILRAALLLVGIASVGLKSLAGAELVSYSTVVSNLTSDVPTNVFTFLGTNGTVVGFYAGGSPTVEVYSPTGDLLGSQGGLGHVWVLPLIQDGLYSVCCRGLGSSTNLEYALTFFQFPGASPNQNFGAQPIAPGEVLTNNSVSIPGVVNGFVFSGQAGDYATLLAGMFHAGGAFAFGELYSTDGTLLFQTYDNTCYGAGGF